MRSVKTIVRKAKKLLNAVVCDQYDSIDEAIAKLGKERVLENINRMLRTDARNWAAGQEGGKLYTFEYGASRSGTADGNEAEFLAGLDEA